MSALKPLWTRIARFAEALEGIDDPTGEYIFSLGKRVDKLEREVGAPRKATAFEPWRRRDTAVDKSSNHVSRSLTGAGSGAPAARSYGPQMIVQGEPGRPDSSVPETCMNHPVRTRPDPDEVRARILEVAEQHCRRIGYHKTSVADIASELGMSRANVYLFFPSRDAINESICRRVVSEVADVAIAIARMDARLWRNSTGF